MSVFADEREPICRGCGHGHSPFTACPGHQWQDRCPYYGLACIQEGGWAAPKSKWSCGESQARFCPERAELNDEVTGQLRYYLHGCRTDDVVKR